jgi:hypothetical protein
MATIKTFKCGCGKEWKTMDGDATGRMLRYDYSGDGEFAIVDGGNRFYCCSRCQNTDNHEWQCGSMFVCADCASGHNESKMCSSLRSSSDDEEEEPPKVWEHLNAYGHAVTERRARGQMFLYSTVEANGPTFQVKHPTEGSHTVNSASSALIAAGYAKAVDERDWWLWIAGWYDDAPEALKNY